MSPWESGNWLLMFLLVQDERCGEGDEVTMVENEVTGRPAGVLEEMCYSGRKLHYLSKTTSPQLRQDHKVFDCTIFLNERGVCSYLL
jgi:hypothetical protein